MKILIPLQSTAAYDKENRNQEQNEEIACHQSIGVKYEYATTTILIFIIIAGSDYEKFFFSNFFFMKRKQRCGIINRFTFLGLAKKIKYIYIYMYK